MDGTAFSEYLLLLQFGPAVLKSVPVLAINLQDDGMKIIYASPLLAEMFGYVYGELRGNSLDMLLLPEHRAKHREYFLRYQQAPTIRTMNEGVWVDGLKKDGTQIKVQVSLCPQEVGKLDMVIAHVADVTRAFSRLQTTRPLEVGH